MNSSILKRDRLFFEVLERALRFWSHVENSCAQAARPNRRRTAQETIARTLLTRLEQILESLIQIYISSDLGGEQKIDLLHKGLDHLAYLHGGPLTAVPRPYEPIELVSYIRQALKSYPDYDPSSSAPPLVFATEILGDQAHSRFDQVDESNFKITTDFTFASIDPDGIGKLAEQLLTYGSEKSSDSDVADNAAKNSDRTEGFISLPRIDLGNPLRWPSLMHETGHFEKGATTEAIWQAFSEIEEGGLSSLSLESMKQYLSSLNIDEKNAKDEIHKWLMECWCDAHATRVAGAPALFSQMHAFLFGTPCYLTEPAQAKGYPPAWFRLRLMRGLISTRHARATPSNDLINKMIAEEWMALEQLFPPSKNADVKYNYNLKNLFYYFLKFLTEQFPQDEWLLQSEIDPDDLSELIEDLSSGLPIPTHKGFKNTHQVRASHAEILLAGWAFRNSSFKASLLDLTKEGFSLKSGLPDLLAIIDRADAALQMSIQVSEWFAILDDDSYCNTHSKGGIETDDDKPAVSNSGLLADHEIIKLLTDSTMRIIPLIGGTNGIVGTVVDVRLGHNFEIFFTNVSGAMDALDLNRKNAVDSMEVDYDSLEGLEIAPGQFVLGHTLEYLKLPKDIAAEVNGRSSFARLGIEVHMTAPFVEAGFDGCLTLEIANSGHSTVKLYPGMRIAQLRFYRCTSVPSVPYGDRSEVKYRGRLRHNKTAQFNDWEIKAFEAEKKRRGI